MHNSLWKETPTILFRDLCGYWRPLRFLYWSQSSQVLVAKHPNSSTEDIISHYCPQCLTKYSEDEARATFFTCPACFICPCCKATMSAITSSEESIPSESDTLFCGLCLWQTNISTLKDTTNEEKRNNNNSDNDNKNVFKFMVDKLLERDQLDLLRASSKHKVLSHAQSAKRGKFDIIDLERKNSFQDTFNSSENFFLQDHLNMNRDTHILQLSVNSSRDSDIPCVLQKLGSGGDWSVEKDLQPLPVMLLTKRTIRCRHDLAMGKMNILIQPKTFPLEGDSSLKIQRGKWWVKDVSAVHEFPFIGIRRFPDKDLLMKSVMMTSEEQDLCVLELLFVNPKESEVSVFIPTDCDVFGPDENDIEDLFSVFSSDKEGSEDDSVEMVNIQVLPSSLPSSGLNLLIGAFEDELLKDDDKDVDIDTMGGQQGDSGVEESIWKFSRHQNELTLQIPVKLSKTEIISKEKKTLFELKLRTIVTIGGVQMPLPLRIIF